tara:strand:- start:121 stop:573 length:453 start_codon:yes stop_codon:yes gene_type:complete
MLRYKKIENMKLNFLIIVTFVIFAWSELSSGEIKILVSNIEEKRGTIHYAIYNNSELFPKEIGKILGGYEEVSKVIKNGLLISDLEESNYAIAIFHDKNSNNKFDTFFSIPKEKFGFSNNARVFLGPPKFEDASFFVGQNSIVEIMIELR